MPTADKPLVRVAVVSKIDVTYDGKRYAEGDTLKVPPHVAENAALFTTIPTAPAAAKEK